MTRSRSQVREQRDEREFVDAVLGIAGSLVMVTDHEGRIERFNKACERATRFISDEVRLRPFWRLLPPGGGRRGSGELRATHRG